MKRTYIALLATTLALQASADVQLLPAGEFAARDGRPGKGKTWKLSDTDGQALAAELTRQHAKTAFVLDYEHQTFHAKENGQPAPAAAWATKFEWRSGQGLFATDVKWTQKAREAVEADEYRYISPVIVWDDTGRVTGMFNAAITNTPALLDMESVSTPVPAQQRLAAMLAAQFTTKDEDMTLLQLLIASLSLKTDATDTDVVTAVAALKAKAEGQPLVPQPLAAALSLKADGDPATFVAAIEGLKGKASALEGANQTIAALNTQLATLQAKQGDDEVDKLVKQGLLDGKLIPATEAWARNLGKSNLDQLKSYLATAPALDANKRQTQQQQQQQDPNADGVAQLTAEDNRVISLLGLDPKEYAKSKQAASSAA